MRYFGIKKDGIPALDYGETCYILDEDRFEGWILFKSGKKEPLTKSDYSLILEHSSYVEFPCNPFAPSDFYASPYVSYILEKRLEEKAGGIIYFKHLSSGRKLRLSMPEFLKTLGSCNFYNITFEDVLHRLVGFNRQESFFDWTTVKGPILNIFKKIELNNFYNIQSNFIADFKNKSKSKLSRGFRDFLSTIQDFLQEDDEISYKEFCDFKKFLSSLKFI